jgi:hypothetical protein
VIQNPSQAPQKLNIARSENGSLEWEYSPKSGCGARI